MRTNIYVDQKTRFLVLAYGILCHLSFGFAVYLMIVCFLSGMTNALGGAGGLSVVLINGFLLIQFPVLHSFFASRQGKSIMAKLPLVGLGRELSSTTFAIIASWQIICLLSCWTPSQIIFYEFNGFGWYIVFLFHGFAWLLLLKAMCDAGLALQTGALGWLSIFRGKKVVYPKMPEQGLFRFVRQPIYLSFSLIVWIVPKITLDQIIIATFLTSYCLIGPILKEARFSQIYGKKFSDYKNKTPYFFPYFIPSGPKRID